MASGDDVLDGLGKQTRDLILENYPEEVFPAIFVGAWLAEALGMAQKFTTGDPLGVVKVGMSVVTGRFPDVEGPALELIRGLLFILQFEQAVLRSMIGDSGTFSPLFGMAIATSEIGEAWVREHAAGVDPVRVASAKEKLELFLEQQGFAVPQGGGE